MKKIVINERKDLQDADIQNIKYFVSSANKLIRDFNGRTTADLIFTKEELDKLFNINSDIHKTALYEVNEKLNGCLDKELDAMNAKSALIRTNFKKGAFETLEKFAMALSDLKSLEGHKYLPQLIVVDGLLNLPEGVEEEIRDSFRVSIKTQQGAKLWDLQKEVAIKLKNLLCMIKGNPENIEIQKLSLSQLINICFTENDGDLIIQELKYDTIMEASKVTTGNNKGQ
jgi:hypothetical protein